MQVEIRLDGYPDARVHVTAFQPGELAELSGVVDSIVAPDTQREEAFCSIDRGMHFPTGHLEDEFFVIADGDWDVGAYLLWARSDQSQFQTPWFVIAGPEAIIKASELPEVEIDGVDEDEIVDLDKQLAAAFLLYAHVAYAQDAWGGEFYDGGDVTSSRADWVLDFEAVVEAAIQGAPMSLKSVDRGRATSTVS